jgi:alkyl hydroperoxide reductase subunit AhpC
MLVYPMSTYRNFDKVLRLLDSLQLTAKHPVSTPVNRQRGDDVVVAPAMFDAEVMQKFPAGFKPVLPYLCIVAQPN